MTIIGGVVYKKSMIFKVFGVYLKKWIYLLVIKSFFISFVMGGYQLRRWQFVSCDGEGFFRCKDTNKINEGPIIMISGNPVVFFFT